MNYAEKLIGEEDHGNARFWLFTDGTARSVSDHGFEARHILNSTAPHRELQKLLYAKGYIRIVIDNQQIWKHGPVPNRLQKDWLLDQSLSRHLPIVDGETLREIVIESKET